MWPILRILKRLGGYSDFLRNFSEEFLSKVSEN
jgi:hypothetical protein